MSEDMREPLRRKFAVAWFHRPNHSVSHAAYAAMERYFDGCD